MLRSFVVGEAWVRGSAEQNDPVALMSPPVSASRRARKVYPQQEHRQVQFGRPGRILCRPPTLLDSRGVPDAVGHICLTRSVDAVFADRPCGVTSSIRQPGLLGVEQKVTLKSPAVYANIVLHFWQSRLLESRGEEGC